MSAISVFLALIVVTPAIIFSLEIIAALVLPERNYSKGTRTRGTDRVAVIIPAHNEESGIARTLQDLKAQLNEHDRLVVVADNCSDNTAAVARQASAEVIERNEPDRKGKGYALAYAISYLKSDPPQFLIVVDADCRIEQGVIHTLIDTCRNTNRPVQSFSSMVAPINAPISTRVAEFAWRVKNYVRPKGLSALGLPCQLMGCGMVFPWAIIRDANLASASIVEDLKLGIDLALAGHLTTYCSRAAVVSEFPTTQEGIKTQRTRWEKGHVNMAMTAWPRLIYGAVVNLNPQLFALAMDLAVPPLSLLLMLLVATLAVTSLAWLLGASSAGLVITMGGFLALSGTSFVAWLTYGRSILPLSSVISVLPYVLGKFGLYRSIIVGRSKSEWIRTDRTKGSN